MDSSSVTEPHSVTHGRHIDEWLEVDPRRVQRATRVATGWAWHACYRVRYYGAEHVPPEGGLLLCANHATWNDGFMVTMGQPRDVRWMGKSEVFRMPVVGRYFRAGGAFPVVRGAGDAAAIEIALRLLEQGEVVSIYPEGTRKGGAPGLHQPRSGAARLALATGVPVVPVASFGIKPSEYPPSAQRPFRRRRATIIYGEPIPGERMESPTRADVERKRDEIWGEIERLWRLARRVNEQRPRPGIIRAEQVTYIASD